MVVESAPKETIAGSKMMKQGTAARGVAQESDAYGEDHNALIVQQVFNEFADTYDIQTKIMFLGLHGYFRSILVERLAPVHGMRLLDVGAGTGNIAFQVIESLQKSLPEQSKQDEGQSHITICDFSKNMLRVGMFRAQQSGVLATAKKVNCSLEWLEANAEQLPLPDSSFSTYSISFCIRLTTHPEKVLQEAYRVLKPGGRLVCLEVSRPKWRLLRWLFDVLKHTVFPVISLLLTFNWHSGKYVVHGLRACLDQENLKGMMETAGFKHVTYENLLFGVVAVHVGFKQ